MRRIPSWSFFSGAVARARSLFRGLRSRSAFEADMADEFRLHIELRTEALMSEGLSRREASRRAHLEFGHIETHKEQARASRGLRFFDHLRFSWIDVKLGLRMLIARPGLTVVAGFALAVGIPVGMAPLHVSRAIEAPLPEDPENRIRAVRYWNTEIGSVALPSRYELDLLEGTLRSFDALGAFRTHTYNLADGDQASAPISGAAVTASTFDILRTPPLLGRTFDRADEEPGGPDVVLLGHDAWQARFGSDPEIVGRSVRVAGVPHTVVGVMPTGFLFPFTQQMWVPLREGPTTQRAEGARLVLFGRLSPSVTSQEAQAEVDAFRFPPGDDPDQAFARLRLEVVPFAFSFVGLPRGGLDATPEFYFFQAFALFLLLVACSNVALLVFAQTATRFREFAVRSALGASRWRIVSQVFIETFILAVLAATVGVTSINWILAKVDFTVLTDGAAVPYWFSLGVTPSAMLLALGLAGLSAAVSGVIPALWMTGKNIQRSLSRAAPGQSGVRFGRLTGALIAADVAVAVAVMAFAVGAWDRLTDTGRMSQLTGVAAEQYLSAEIRLPSGDGATGDGSVLTTRLARAQRELVERLEAEPGVRSVTVASALPRMNHGSRMVAVEGTDPPPERPGRYVRAARIDIGFFEALGHPILAGRNFASGDLTAETPPVIVNRVFVEELLGGGDPIGRRVRLIQSGARLEEEWREIVGVVGHLGMNIVDPQGDAGIYLPASPGSIHPMKLAVHLGTGPELFAPRLREIAAEVNPDLIVDDPMPLHRVYQGDWYLMMAVTGGFGLAVAILIALAASSIYAIVSVSVSDRTREIGIRTALGASRRTLVVTILRRSLTQIGIGGLLGVPLAARMLFEIGEEAGTGSTAAAIATAILLGGAIVTVVGCLSCLIPARRTMGIEASDALRMEG